VRQAIASITSAAATQVCVLLFRVSEMVAAAVDLPKVSTGLCASLAPISAAPFLSGKDYSCALLFALITTAAVYFHHAFSAREAENFGKIKKPSAQQRCFFIIRRLRRLRVALLSATQH
jgi:hypothetical protein